MKVIELYEKLDELVHKGTDGYDEGRVQQMEVRYGPYTVIGRVTVKIGHVELDDGQRDIGNG